jgi:hypothetical protein
LEALPKLEAAAFSPILEQAVTQWESLGLPKEAGQDIESFLDLYDREDHYFARLDHAYYDLTPSMTDLLRQYLNSHLTDLVKYL